MEKRPRRTFTEEFKKQLERIAAALNARLDVRFIDNETGQPII